MLGVAGGSALLFTQHVGALAAAAFIGMVNGMGRDRGAALALEQAVLPSAVADARPDLRLRGVQRGAGLRARARRPAGRGAAPLAVVGRPWRARERRPAWRQWRCTSRSRCCPCCSIRCSSPAVEVTVAPGQLPPLSAETRQHPVEARIALRPRRTRRRIPHRRAALIFLLTGASAWASRWSGALFFGARSRTRSRTSAPAWLARRIGLVNTMVFTHTPSSLAARHRWRSRRASRWRRSCSCCARGSSRWTCRPASPT